LTSILKINRWYFCIPFGLGLIPNEVFNAVFGGASLLIFLFWVYAISIKGQERLQSNGLKTSATFLFKSAVFLLPFLILIQFFNERNLIFPQNTIASVLINMLSILLIIACVFYIYYFTAKTLTMLQLQREVTINEIYKNFLLIGLSIIGIIFIQPKLNQLILTKNL